MSQNEIVKCQKCGTDTPRDNSYASGAQILCEDCYFKGTSRVQACDPFAVRSAERFRKVSGLEATDGLTKLQKAIYEFIQSRGKATAGELIAALHISDQELESQIAILRHCELVKGQKEGNKVYLTPF